MSPAPWRWALCRMGPAVWLVGCTGGPAPGLQKDPESETAPEDSGLMEVAPCMEGTPELVVNQQEAGDWVPLLDGDTVRLVHGIQGGWHIESAALVTLLHPDSFLRVTGTDVETGHTFCTIQTHVRLTPSREGDLCGGQSPETLCIVDQLGPLDGDDTPGALLDGRTVDLTVYVTDIADVSAEQTLRLTLASDP